MIQLIKAWIATLGCEHQYRYSRSKPGTLVCKRCRKRKPKPKG